MKARNRRLWATVVAITCLLLWAEHWLIGDRVLGSFDQYSKDVKPTPILVAPVLHLPNLLLEAAGSIDFVDSATAAQTIGPAIESDSSAGPTSTNETATTFPVTLNDKTLFTITVGTSAISAQQRANIATRELANIAKDTSIPIGAIKWVDLDDRALIVAADPDTDEQILILALTSNDAEAAKKSLQNLATDYLDIIQTEITQYRQQYGLKAQSLRLTGVVVATLGLTLLFYLIHRLFAALKSRIERWRQLESELITLPLLQLFSKDTLCYFLLRMLQFLRWFLLLIGLYLYFLVLSLLFPATQKLSQKAFTRSYELFYLIWQNFVSFLPRLLLIALVILVAYFLIQVDKRFFKAVRKGTITIPGFYTEWALPTARLIAFFIVAIAATIIVPYLPGYNSLAFRSISVFLGALLTFGGASSVSNLISGLFISYSRAFSLGDLIQIDDIIGLVHNLNLLTTQIRTFDGEIVTVPNSVLLTKEIVNYSVILRELGTPITVRTTITLGYNLPWRQVYQVLTEAALATQHILPDPAPYVLQTSLNDFYVSYKLIAFTKNPGKAPWIYSALYENIQDKCAEAGIEIMSPHYAALRDGNSTTIPASNLPKEYES
jgi:small-conductance mechanosensitive channel